MPSDLSGKLAGKLRNAEITFLIGWGQNSYKNTTFPILWLVGAGGWRFTLLGDSFVVVFYFFIFRHKLDPLSYPKVASSIIEVKSLQRFLNKWICVLSFLVCIWLDIIIKNSLHIKWKVLFTCLNDRRKVLLVIGMSFFAKINIPNFKNTEFT